jgi:hypothetical protein
MRKTLNLALSGRSLGLARQKWRKKALFLVENAKIDRGNDFSELKIVKKEREKSKIKKTCSFSAFLAKCPRTSRA